MKIKISLGTHTFNPQQSTHFKCETVDLTDLKDRITKHSYSLITWKIDNEASDSLFNRKRQSNNFESASGIVIDIDEGLSIEGARKRLLNEQLNHIIITSKSLQKEKGNSPVCDRFHILVFFDKETTSAEKYKAAYQKMETIFPEMDSSIKDLARFIYASPVDAEYYEYFDGKYIGVEELSECIEDTILSHHSRNIFEFSIEQSIKLSNGKIGRAHV